MIWASVITVAVLFGVLGFLLFHLES